MKYFLLTMLIGFTQIVYAFNLYIHIDNINTLEGKIQIIIYNSKKSFLKDGKEFKILQFPIDSNKMSYQVNNLPPGIYAIAILHDKNADGQCAKNLLGIPTEGYGFSNNFVPKFAPPDFEDVHVKMHKDTTVNIKLLY